MVSYKRLMEIYNIKPLEEGKLELFEINTIQLKNVSFRRDNKVLFENFFYEFSKGNIYGIEGENGCGKTTLLNILLGLNNGEYTGEILYDGIKIENRYMGQARKK